MKRGEFVMHFLKAAGDLAGELLDVTSALLVRESLQAKILRMGGNDPTTIYRGMKNLERRGIVRVTKRNVAFTKKGATWLRQARAKYFIQLARNGKWDGKWRVVIFDIPQELHNARNVLRTKLKSLGFCMLQKSIFVVPFPCEEELGYLCSELKISDYVDVLVAETLGSKESEIKKFFGV